MKMDLVV